MAEWYRITLKSQLSTVSFGAIGHPFSFVSAPLDYQHQEVRAFRCFEKPKGNETMSTLSYLPYVLQECEKDEGLELFEKGWYLTGVGHHQVWCGVNLKDAVDEAQEHIAWDGRNPAELPMTGREKPDGSPSHLLPCQDESAWLDDSLWFGMFTGAHKTETPPF